MKSSIRHMLNGAFLLSGDFDYFEVLDFAVGDFEAEKGADLVKAL